MPSSVEKTEQDEFENVRVVVRVRPIIGKELDCHCQIIVFVDTFSNTITVRNSNTTYEEPPKTFSFDAVFDSKSTQVDIYNETARPIIDKVLQGYNGTIFAYGQTGTGKTYTMTGTKTSPQLRGIIPNSFAHIFGYIAKADENRKFLVRATYLEIYNEEIRDLLGKDQNHKLEVKERPDIGVYVKDLSGYVVNNADDLDRIMTIGNKSRVIGATAMNVCSSRSHAIFTITVESSQIGKDGQQHVKVGKLHLVDLAGSERQSKSKATGIRLREATKINLSLSTLGNVISALVDGQSLHVPYRNSKLTRLLQDSLGGNSKTLMCANISPADINYDETISTLRYANRAKNIKNRARINEDPKDALLRQFQIEIEQLRHQLKVNGPEMSDSEDDSEESREVTDVQILKTNIKCNTLSSVRNKNSEISNIEIKCRSEKYLETFNDVDIIELRRTQKSYGRVLVLDGIIQCTERDEFSYQEMISFLPLCSHQNPKTILIVGGGDGGVAREVAKFPGVEKIIQIEIDEKVVEVSKAFLPFMAKGLTNSKVNLCIGDGYDFIKQQSNEFDIIITDSGDPIGPAISLFQEPYFTSMKKALKPGGIVCSQAGTLWSNLDQVKTTLRHCKSVFPRVGYGISSVPTYPTGQIGYILGSLNSKTNFQEPIKLFTDDELNKMGLLYYSHKIHRACFQLPRFAEKELQIEI